MLKLKNIKKDYLTLEEPVHALNGISINFRKSEFVSILGPSGCGKTTLLNIIGGLDRYSSGDLIINGKSTKEFTDREWDSYRNHRIGFVFQSYNLISHQSVLQNVVLALTLSGISKKEGIKRAKQALIDVGLEDHIYKKPNQLSGGQMQRVAIARALVNNPDILLADEPTGALDSKTSVQIMKLLKKIAKDKLVIMVTHNPELAKEYSNRIIELKDGKITSDSNPFDVKKEKEIEKYIKTKKTSMSYLTALGLSFNNLMTKKGRTVLVAFAGSIGIIGIALILSLSTGFQNYIDKLQEDTLSSYPLTITRDTADMTSMLLSMVGDSSNVAEGDMVVEQQYIASMFSNIKTNDMKSFKNYLEQNHKKVDKDISSIKYSYSIDPVIYTKTLQGKIVKVNPNSMFTSMSGGNGITSLYSSYSSVFTQLIDDQDALDSQYDVLAGSWPKKYNEMVLVLPAKNAIPDMLVYFLGLRDIDELYDMVTKLMSGESVTEKNEPLELSYEQLMNIEFKLVNPSDLYKYNDKYKIYENMENDSKFVEKLFKSSEGLKISGIVTAKKGVSSMALNPGVAYRSDLVEHIIDNASKSAIVKKQLSNTAVDVFSGKRFDELDETSSELNFEDMISIDEKMLESAFNIKIDQKEMEKTTTNYMNEISDAITTDTTPAGNDFDMTLVTFATDIFKDYMENPLKTMALNPMDPEMKIPVIYAADVKEIVNTFMLKESSKKFINELEKNLPADLFIEGEKPKDFVENFIREYLNYLVYKFLGIKAYRFKDIKSGHYMLKDLEQRSLMKGKDLAENFAQWFDELYLGKYDLIPFFKVNKLTDEKFELKVHIKNRNNGETILIDQLYTEDKIWDLATEDIGKIVEKQLNYALRYMPELETLFEDEDKLSLELNLNEVYKIIAQTAYYLQKAQIEVILPEELTNIIIPRASINAKIKAKRLDDLKELLANPTGSTISLDEIMNFILGE